MRVLRHCGNSEQRALQLRSMIDDLKRGVLLLEGEIAAVMKSERRANPAMSAYHIAARTLKDRRDNLVLTIQILEGKLTEIGSAPLRQSNSEMNHLRA